MTIEDKLINEYEQILNSRGAEPDWAVHKRYQPEKLVRCTVPFVGKEYTNQKQKILVYL